MLFGVAAASIIVMRCGFTWDAIQNSMVRGIANAQSATKADATALATFAGGCFWCMEQPFERLDGVYEAISGFAGGTIKNPSYQQVLDVYWHQIDPTDDLGSFVDRGPHYRPAIFFHSKNQQQQAQASIDSLNEIGRFPKLIKVELIEYQFFYQAEDYHQNYYRVSPLRYHYYRDRSGRDDYLDQIWGKKRNEPPKFKTTNLIKYDKEQLKQSLTPLQYQVTQNDATERRFDNEYWDNTQAGIYVDIVSGTPLFSSLDKYRSGTGWPSFSQPIDAGVLTEKVDKGFFRTRVEIRSTAANSHLGHLFNDGPKPNGLRYCINSASLRFVAVNQLTQQGYDKYRALFQK